MTEKDDHRLSEGSEKTFQCETDAKRSGNEEQIGRSQRQCVRRPSRAWCRQGCRSLWVRHRTPPTEDAL
jgi:hypothetical protein